MKDYVKKSMSSGPNLVKTDQSMVKSVINPGTY
jgi:hypothetical protein